MPSVILQTPWTRQPQVPVGVNWANPLSSALAVLAVGADYLTPGQRGRMTIANLSPTFGAGAAGIGPQFSGGAQRITAGALGNTPSTEGFTIEVLCAFTATQNLGGVFGLEQTSGRALIVFNGTRNIYFWGNSADLTSGVDWRIDGSLQHVFCTSASGSGSPMTFYQDGKVIATGTTPGISTISAPTVRFGDMNQGWSATPTGNIFKAAYYRRALSGSEVATLSANPWQIFAPLQRRIWLGAASAAVDKIPYFPYPVTAPIWAQ